MCLAVVGRPTCDGVQGWLFSIGLLLPRGGPEALGEEEEPKGPLRVQDLQGACVQPVHGVQEWRDGCVYQGEFGLDTKLGYGEFSWPTGEVSRLQGPLPEGLPGDVSGPARGSLHQVGSAFCRPGSADLGAAFACK